MIESTPRAVLSRRSAYSYIGAELDADAQDDRANRREFVEELAWRIFVHNGLESLPAGFRFCSVGASAGRWSLRMLEHCGLASGIAIHRTRESLLETTRIRDANGYQSRLQVESSSGNVLACPSQSFDVSFGLPDAFGSSDRPAVLMQELVRATKPEGLIVIRVPNLAHAVQVNVAHGRLEEARRALDGRAEISPHTQEQNVFTPQSVERLLRGAGAEPRITVGFPTLVPLSRQQTESGASATHVAALVADDASRSTVLSIEEDLLNGAKLSPRGEELLAIGVVPPNHNGWGDFWYTE